MASSLKNLSTYNANDIPSGKGKKIGISYSEYHEEITFALLKGCILTLKEHGVQEEDIYIHVVPGTFELPYAAQKLIREEKLDAVICIGCVIKGETDHDQYINTAVTNAIMELNLKHDLPVIFGVLTPNTKQQAMDRCGGKHGNKGVEAAVSALKMSGI